MCTVKVPISFGDNRCFKSNMLCSSDGPFRTLIETWLGSGVLIIAHNLSLIRNLKQSEYCLYKCSVDCCGKFTKTLLTNKDINTPVLSFWWGLNLVDMMFSYQMSDIRQQTSDIWPQVSDKRCLISDTLHQMSPIRQQTPDIRLLTSYIRQ